jgi:hypothetical protein
MRREGQHIDGGQTWRPSGASKLGRLTLWRLHTAITADAATMPPVEDGMRRTARVLWYIGIVGSLMAFGLFVTEVRLWTLF